MIHLDSQVEGVVRTEPPLFYIVPNKFNNLSYVFRLKNCHWTVTRRVLIDP